MMKNVKIFGIGGLGGGIVDESFKPELPSLTPNSSIITLDTCAGTLRLNSRKKYLCGETITRRLGCGGSIGRGYAAAFETLHDKIKLFDTKLNIFVIGLGGGTSGMLEFILDMIHSYPTMRFPKKHRMNNKEFQWYYRQHVRHLHNKYNIVVCTFPSDFERNRINSAKTILGRIEKSADLICMLELDDVRRSLKLLDQKGITAPLFQAVRTKIISVVSQVQTMNEKELKKLIKKHKKQRSNQSPTTKIISVQLKKLKFL